MRVLWQLVASFAASCAIVYGAAAQDRAIEDIRVTTDGDQATILIELACQMRFVADTPIQEGALLEVRVAPFDDCLGNLRPNITSETYRPAFGDAARLVEVEYSELGPGDSLILLRFARPVSYVVTQRPTLRSVEIVVDLSSADVPDRDPISVRVVEVEVASDYMINLQSTTSPVAAEAIDAVPVTGDQQVYVSQIRVDGEVWNRLRWGFFASEADARAALAGVSEFFPRTWIGRAEPAEIELAAQLSPPGRDTASVLTLTPDQLEAGGSTSVDAAEVTTMMTAGRNALIDGDNERAIEIYSDLVQVPGEHRAEALEFLGLAYERNSQTARSRAAYEQVLREFPKHDSRARVEQRLESVLTAESAPKQVLRDARAVSDDAWDWSMGVSQYVRQDESQFNQELPSITIQSALLTDADFSVSRAGESFDMLARVSLNHYRDLLDEEDGRGDQNRVSYAWFDIADVEQQWSLRLGRQSLHNWGVLGRFDGAHFSYGLGADRRLHVTTGYPVESTRDNVEPDRQFAGLAVEFTDVVGTWDMSVFLNQQTLEGVDARLASGFEVRYYDDRRSLTGMLDYDMDFGELNLALVLGTWRLLNRITVSALFDQRKSPILSTRNALIGQPVATLEEMLLVWTEEEVRQLALDRTTDTSTMTLGVATPLAERLQLNFDVTSTTIDGTVASGGVSAIPGTGAQLFYSTSLVGTGLFARSDVSVWNVRVGDADNYQSRLFSWDARFAIGRRLRINPRIRYSIWESIVDGRERETLSPSLRFLLNTRNGYRFELELGQHDITRTTAGQETETRSSFFNMGYRAYF